MNSSHFFSRFGIAAIVLLSTLMTGCAQLQIGAPAATVDNIQKAKASGLPPSNVGGFALAKDKPADMDKSFSLRSNGLTSPTGSFSKHLQETLAAELKAAGLLDPASTTTIQGELTDNQLDASIGTGKGALAARFVVNRSGQTIYDKVLRSDATWESSFVGAVAIPAAVNEYSGLYRKLVAQLLDDPQFRTAVAAK